MSGGLGVDPQNQNQAARRRYKFVGRAGNRYVWQSVERMPGDSRVEVIRCAVDWFWNPVGVSGGTATAEQER